MNGTGTLGNARRLGAGRSMRRRAATTLAMATCLLAVIAAALAPSASAAPRGLAGTWISVDLDGSNQTLRIRGAGKPVYAVFVRDDFTSGVCGGPPAKLVGHGVAHGTELLVRGTLVCLHGGNPIPRERVVISFEHDADADTLTDGSGVVWERGG